jgi:hypothetical protein
VLPPASFPQLFVVLLPVSSAQMLLLLPASSQMLVVLLPPSLRQLRVGLYQQTEQELTFSICLLLKFCMAIDKEGDHTLHLLNGKQIDQFDQGELGRFKKFVGVACTNKTFGNLLLRSIW